MTLLISYIVLLTASAAISLALVVVTLRVKPPAGRSFALLQTGTALWSILHAIELASPRLETKIVVINLLYVAVSATVIGWVMFTLSHSGYREWLTRRRLIALSAPLILYLPVIWTNEQHHLYGRFLLDESGPYPGTLFEGGPLFWPYVGYAYTLLTIGLILRFRSLARFPQLYRGQIAALILGGLIPFVGSILNVAQVTPRLLHADITPLSFNISSLLYSYVVLRGRLFSLLPIARDVVIENLSDALMVLDAEDRILDINAAAPRLLGRPDSAVIGRTVAEALPNRLALIERYRNVPEAQAEIVLDNLDGPGTVRFYELRIQPIQGRDGAMLGRTVLLHDMTQRKRLERQLSDQLQESLLVNNVLAAANSSLDIVTIMETICRELAGALDLPQAAVAAFDDEQKTMQVIAEYVGPGREPARRVLMPVQGNPVAEKLIAERKTICIADVRTDPLVAPLLRHLNVNPDEASERRGTLSVMIVPMFIRERIIGSLGLDSIEPREFAPEEVRLAERVVAVASQALANARLYEALQQELVERRKAQAELQIAKEIAETANEAQSAFLANMSHELRTPLNSIIGYTDLLIQGMYGPINDKQTARLDAVRRNGNHRLSLINDVLDLSKIEAGRMEMRIEPLAIKPILDNCLTAIEPQALKTGLSVERDLPAALPPVLGDAGRGAQIITNLLGNAVKFTTEGSVTVSARPLDPRQDSMPTKDLPSPCLLIAVRDTGIGIAKEDHAIIFDEFRQVDTSTTREFEGTGLGLAITRKLVQLMNGQVWLDSAPGRGSTFYVTLPIAGN